MIYVPQANQSIGTRVRHDTWPCLGTRTHAAPKFSLTCLAEGSLTLLVRYDALRTMKSDPTASVHLLGSRDGGGQVSSDVDPPRLGTPREFSVGAAAPCRPDSGLPAPKTRKELPSGDRDPDAAPTPLAAGSDRRLMRGVTNLSASITSRTCDIEKRWFVELAVAELSWGATNDEGWLPEGWLPISQVDRFQPPGQAPVLLRHGTRMTRHGASGTNHTQSHGLVYNVPPKRNMRRRL